MKTLEERSARIKQLLLRNKEVALPPHDKQEFHNLLSSAEDGSRICHLCAQSDLDTPEILDIHICKGHALHDLIQQK